MLSPKWKPLHRMAQSLRGSLTMGGALILLYHRVADISKTGESDPWSLCVTPQNFANQLVALQGTGRVVPLSRLLQGVKDRDDSFLAQRPIAITFDDGYADNLYAAKPLLEKHQIPATLFLTAGYLDSTMPFWSDALEQLILGSHRLPEQMQIAIGNTICTHTFPPNSSNQQINALVENRNTTQEQPWRAWDRPCHPRQELYQKLYYLLLPVDDNYRKKALGHLLTWVRSTAPEFTFSEAARPLTLSEARSFSKGGLMETGAHTLTHPNLVRLSVHAQHHEVTTCKADLEEKLDQPILSFAYPYGQPGTHYSSDTVALVQAAGYLGACSNYSGLVNRTAPLYELPRVQINDWSGDEFARRLCL